MLKAVYLIYCSQILQKSIFIADFGAMNLNGQSGRSFRALGIPCLESTRKVQSVPELLMPCSGIS